MNGDKVEGVNAERKSTSRREVLTQGSIAVGMVTVAGCLQSGPPSGEHPEPAVIGHRGCAAENPENTITAIMTAGNVSDAVEIDIRRCKTGEIVVFHDETLDRLTTENGRVKETSCKTVVSLEVRDSGERIPTLREVFEAVPTNVKLVLDLKEPGLTADVLAHNEEYDHELLLSSFHPSILEEIRERDSTVSTAYIVRESLNNRPFRPVIPGLPSWAYVPEDVTDIIERTVALGCDTIHPRYELCLQTDLVTQAHSADLRVEPWTITTRREFEALRGVGVDAVISDICTDLVD